jgi:hypothetical protein
VFDVHTGVPASPHPVSLVCPVSALQEDAPYSLRSAAALALVGVCLVDGVKVGLEADLACAHLCDHGADRSVRPDVRLECRLARPHAKPEEVPTVLGGLPRGVPLAPHGLADGGFRGRHEGWGGGSVCVWASGWEPVTRKIKRKTHTFRGGPYSEVWGFPDVLRRGGSSAEIMSVFPSSYQALRILEGKCGGFPIY